MHRAASGKVISLPGSGFLWHVLQSKPSAKCFLWLYGIGCTGAGCSLGLSGTTLFVVSGGVPCSAGRLRTKMTSAAKVIPGIVRETGLLAFIPLHLASEALLFRLRGYAFLFTTSSMLVPKSLRMTAAAFRPGPPVTDPPGCVVAPVGYRPGSGMRCCGHPGAGRVGHTCDAHCARPS